MRVRNRGGAPATTYQWTERSNPSQVNWARESSDVTVYVNVVSDPPKTLPDVPLNVDHRYCTPPPLDPRYIIQEEPRKDDFPQYLGPDISPSDFEQDGAPPGTWMNPLVIEGGAEARQFRENLFIGPPPGLEDRRGAASTAPPPPAAPPAQPAARRPAQIATDLDPDIAESRTARYKKTAADGFSPKTSSPLKRVAFRAPSPMPVSRWYIPPRKKSAGSVSASSTSSDTESEYSDYQA
ncbi:hypothetical protein BD413DRAFT_292138 [Trametes elegans]|nr:hypothetical protein BD413DRAFT_292138 [Trametes elegans]